jgi:hypothetical protein
VGTAAEESLSAVVCTTKAFAGLSARQCAKVLGVLQSATEDGGVHLVETIVARIGYGLCQPLKKSYKGWDVSVPEDGKSFVARKAVA